MKYEMGQKIGKLLKSKDGWILVFSLAGSLTLLGFAWLKVGEIALLSFNAFLALLVASYLLRVRRIRRQINQINERVGRSEQEIAQLEQAKGQQRQEMIQIRQWMHQIFADLPKIRHEVTEIGRQADEKIKQTKISVLEMAASREVPIFNALLPKVADELTFQELDKLNNDKVICVIGRGRSGTRLITRALRESGVFMGDPLNESEDLIPPDYLYEACKVMGRQIRYKQNFELDFSQLEELSASAVFKEFVRLYLCSLLTSSAPLRGWKLPENNLIFPWLVQLLPNVKYIYWVRDPRDVILGPHVTDNLSNWSVPCERLDNVLRMRAQSWKYQYDIVKQARRPKNFITIKFEDFVLEQEKTLPRLEKYLGFPLKKIESDPSRIARWKTDAAYEHIEFLEPALEELGYEP